LTIVSAIEGLFSPVSLLWRGVIGGGLGLILGSYLATLIIRWPLGISANQGRSRCDSCGAGIAAYDLIPLISALLLRFRCRACHAVFDRSHFWVEIAAGVIGVLAFLASPLAAGFSWAILGWLLLALAVLDWRHYWLPDRLVLLLALAGLLLGGAVSSEDVHNRLIGSLAGFGSLWLLAYIFQRVRGKQGMGGGDPKMMGALGLWFGWAILPILALVAAMIGLVLALYLPRKTAQPTMVPFGSCLAIAAWPAFYIAQNLLP
jgi:leader peptidase (prepilin peptidase)/N-methyltransferase